MTTPSARQAEIIDQFESALSDMTNCACSVAESMGSADDIDFVFFILEENKMNWNVRSASFDEEMDIIDVKAGDLLEEDPSMKIARLHSALFNMSNHVRRMFRAEGLLQDGEDMVFGILENNGIGEG